MDLHRDILQQLKQWKERDNRKPLIIQGARQIGKTWVMLKFGELNYKHVAYFNFESTEELCNEFEHTKDPVRLIGLLKLYTDVPIEPGNTLIIFDEVQQCNKALNSLKYFCEQAPEYHIMAAGSLLGVSLSHGDSFPVGKVEFMHMYPLNFKEFLLADDKRTYDYIEGITSIEPLPEIIINKLIESYRRYQVCGGMPAAVLAMLGNMGLDAVVEQQQNILNAYALDFAKHAPTPQIPRINAIWQSIPSQLSRENRKFLYKLVRPGARAREYEDALLWLQQAGLIYRIECCDKPGLPLSTYDNISAFKIYLCDIGLLRCLAQLPPQVFFNSSEIFTEFKGAFAENAVLQCLVGQFDVMPRYWVSGATAEVEFLLQYGLNILPIEVKSGESLQGQSIKVYRDRYHPSHIIRFSMRNLRLDGNVLNISLPLAPWLSKFFALLLSTPTNVD